MTDAELVLKLREAAAIIKTGGELWDDTWGETFLEAAERLADCDQ